MLFEGRCAGEVVPFDHGVFAVRLCTGLRVVDASRLDMAAVQNYRLVVQHFELVVCAYRRTGFREVGEASPNVAVPVVCNVLLP